MANRAYFVIADITGYTAFLTGSELDHAQDILKSLFNCLLDNIKPPLIISNFQGDAILTYAPEGSFTQGQILLESVENIYCAFANQLELMHQNTTCTCKACSNIPNLDLKLFVHFGEYLIQDMRGKAELSGPDVIIAHRMMKNNVKETTGLKAYTLFSAAAINELGLQDFTCEMKSHSETYEHIGEVPMYVYCLKTMWEREREKYREMVTPEETWITFETDIAAPPSLIWGYYIDPQHRLKTMGSNVVGITLSGVQSGRLGSGSTVHCVHGNNSQSEFLILDWKPFEYITEHVTGFPFGLYIKTCLHFVPTETGTHLRFDASSIQADSMMGKMVAPILGMMMKSMLSGGYESIFKKLGEIIHQDQTEGKLVLATTHSHGQTALTNPL